MKYIIGVLLLTSCFLAGCEEQKDVAPTTPFCLDKTYYEARWGRGETTIPIMNGSGDIQLDITNENILQASYQKELQADGAIGTVTLHGKQKGSTTLTLTDNVTHDQETVEVKVTDCYLAYTVDKSNCPALAAGAVLFFVSNEAQALHLFASDNQSDTPTTTGTYEFFVRQDNGGSLRPYLRIGFPSGTAEGTSDIPHEFVLSFNNPQAVLSIIQGYLGMDWDALIRTPTAKNTAPQRFTMTLTNPDSGHETTGTFSTASIPEHVLE